MAFDQGLALLYGDFVQAVYDMYEPNDLKPPPSPNFPAGYQLIGWVTMTEVFAGDNESFFGFFAHNANDPSDAVLAIRGTEPGEEWTDIISQLMKPFKVPGKGNVGVGWESLYETFRVTDCRTMKALNGTFSEQADELLRGHAARPSVQVTGHSLGAALATLYAAESSFTHQLTSIKSLYTFGSPMVGDGIFADAFDEIGLESWRIANVQDWAPKLPLFFQHISKLRPYNSRGKVKQTFMCVHDLPTYLSLIDPKRKPNAECQLRVHARDSETV
jgi:Lipase (class 3)